MDATGASLVNTPPDDPLAWLRGNVARPPFHAFLRPEPLAVDMTAGTVSIRLPYRPEFRRTPEQEGYHGGILASLIDLAGHAVIAVRVGHMVPTIDLRIDYLRAAPGTDLMAHAKLLRAGRSIATADVEIVDLDGKVIAVGRGTYSTA
jgi:uncharacterized protein (TIGR00369 family)